MKIYFTLLSLLAFQCFSQDSTYILDHNSVAARLMDNGMLFQNVSSGTAAYSVPKDSLTTVIFSSSIWIGATDLQGNLHMAALRYASGEDFFSGPYSTNNSYNDSLYLQKYDQSIWAVTRAEINFHMANYWTPGYVPVPSIANWPGNGDVSLGVVSNLAPFVDMNSDNIYNPLDGDYPDVRGDEAAYIILNDSKGIHTETNGEPLGIEVHIMASQYASTDFLDSTTFLNIRVFNRGVQLYSNVKFGLFMDGDIGNYADDYFGCAPNKDMMYFYNGDNFDGNGGATSYGANPPAVGVVSLSKPMETCGFFTSVANFPYSDPTVAFQYWHFMSAQWADGSPWTYGGWGYPSSPGGSNSPTNFMFDGNPLTGVAWSEVTNNNPPDDRRGIMVLQTTSIFPDEMSCYDMAVIYSRSGGTNLQNVQSLMETADSVKQFYNDQVTYNCNQVTAETKEINESDFSIYPNPSTGNVFIESPIDYDLSIYDFHGRLIQAVSNQSFEKSVELNLTQGVYLFEFETITGKITRKVIITD